MEKRGLSAVVTTVIMILLVLFAIGIVYVVVKDIIGGSGRQIDVGTKCLSTQLSIESATCVTGGLCTVTVTKSGGYNPDGVIFVFSNATTSGDGVPNTSSLEVSRVYSGLIPGISAPTSVSATAFYSEDGEQVTCSQIATSSVTLS